MDKRSLLPNFCTVRVVFTIIIVTEMLAIVLVLCSIDSVKDFSQELGFHSLFIQWIALIGAGVLCLLRSTLHSLRDGVVALLAWIILMLITLLMTWSGTQIANEMIVREGIHLFYLRTLGIGAIVSALMLHYLNQQQQWRLQVEAESQSRLQALQSRIRPHFLFNSMNTIIQLTRTDPKLAEQVVQDLSDLFRASLSDACYQSTLAQELELTESYLRIEKQRLGERLSVSWDLETLPEQAQMPALILQPLVENAVNHGIEPSNKPGKITISGRYRRKKVNLSIRNTLPTDGPSSTSSGNQMALENIRQRLIVFFDDQTSLTVSEVDGQHQIRLVFPYPRR